MDYARLKDRIWFLRYWPLAVVALLIGREVLNDGYLIPAAFLVVVGIVWFALSAIEALY